VRLATLPTPLEPGPVLPGGARLWVKRDDLTGLGMGGNKARKLEVLCAEAELTGADTLVTVGAGQSNHCRMTAAAGAVLGLEVHLVLGGTRPEVLTGNQLLAARFGATMHFPGTERWHELEAAMADLAGRLRAEGRVPFTIPIGGSTPLGAVGFAAAAAELAAQCRTTGLNPVAVVHATSSGGTHAGLLAGFAALWAEGERVPAVVAVGVAKGVIADRALTAHLARGCLATLGLDPLLVVETDVTVESDWLGPDYGVDTPEAQAAADWAARHGAWVLDPVYTAKAFAGLLAMAEAGRWGPGDDVVFWHTGGQPAVFAH
jgi:1-aminocyclopropane-1-carboxylate deaminase/D-cysteine desulfhydrase-like pyridoxal-dependent ACC family enzyme